MHRPDRCFPIAREPADLSFDDFYARYYLREQPVIIENLAGDWPACARWTEDYLQHALSAEPRAKASALWYWLETGALQDDYRVPDIVDQLYARDATLPRTENLRIWIHLQTCCSRAGPPPFVTARHPANRIFSES